MQSADQRGLRRLHVVGWTFQGRIGLLNHLAQTAAPLLLLSLQFGSPMRKTGSLYAPLVVDILNNFYQFALKSG
jgi:hypothetical protein